MNIYVDGGVTVRRFLSEGLLSSLVITEVSVVLGAGIPLLPEGFALSEHFALEATKKWDAFGFVQKTYARL